MRNSESGDIDMQALGVPSYRPIRDLLVVLWSHQEDLLLLPLRKSAMSKWMLSRNGSSDRRVVWDSGSEDAELCAAQV